MCKAVITISYIIKNELFDPFLYYAIAIMDISIFHHFTNRFHGNQLFCVIPDTFKMKEGFLLERDF